MFVCRIQLHRIRTKTFVVLKLIFVGVQWFGKWILTACIPWKIVLMLKCQSCQLDDTHEHPLGLSRPVTFLDFQFKY
jgi:hypothetical protein